MLLEYNNSMIIDYDTMSLYITMSFIITVHEWHPIGKLVECGGVYNNLILRFLIFLIYSIISNSHGVLLRHLRFTVIVSFS